MVTPVLKLEHVDARGEIYSITLPGDQELMLLHSVAGSLRGGHAHDVDELVVMLTGKMQYHKKKILGVDITGGTEWQETVEGGDYCFNPKGLVHMGEFLEDTWLLEFKLNTKKGAWRNLDHQPWRERVVAHSAG